MQREEGREKGGGNTDSRDSRKIRSVHAASSAVDTSCPTLRSREFERDGSDPKFLVDEDPRVDEYREQR